MIWMCFTAHLKRPDWHPAPAVICTSLQAPPSLPPPPPPPPPPILHAFKVCVEDVNRVFRKQKSMKASGPDSLSPACLKVCADHLDPIFTQILFPVASNAPPSFPSPKSPKSLALTTTGLWLSRLWSWSHLRDWCWRIWRTSLGPWWILFSLPTEQTGLWMTLSIWDCITSCKTGKYARILFMDFSSAFNTIMPDLLQDKQTQWSVPTSICQWITSFHTDRQQLVKLGKLTSRTLTISTGAPQGWVLSPLLFSLYTNDCTSKDPSVKILKFVTTLQSSVSSRTEMSLLTDRRLKSWLSGAVLTTWS